MTREQTMKIQKVAVLLLTVCLLLCTRQGTAQNATTILDKAAATYEASGGISATFVMHTRYDAQKASENFEGTIEMKGDKFRLETPDMKVWFDGTTQWSYVERNEEVNVTTPSGEELQLTNPTLLLKSYKKGFTAKYVGESTAESGKSAYDVELTAKKKSDIVKVALQIEKSSAFPVKICVETKNGVSTTIHIRNLKTGLDIRDESFTFKESEYPDAEVIDLR